MSHRVPWTEVRQLVAPAFTIAALGAIESLLSAVADDGMSGGRHRSNMELVANGVANLVVPPAQRAGDRLDGSHGDGTRVLISEAHAQPTVALGRSAALALIGEENPFGRIEEATAAAKRHARAGTRH